MERRHFLAIATTALLAGCPSDGDATPSPSPTNATSTGTTTTESPGGPTTATDAPTGTDAATETPSETETRTERPPDPEAAEELDEARTRLSRAVENYASESHRPQPDSILETTADSEGFLPGRVTGAIDDARQSLSRAEEPATPSQQETIEQLRGLADWLEQAVAVQVQVVAAAADCRTALAGSVPHDDREIKSAFQTLAATVEAAESVAESLSPFFGDVSDRIEGIESGTVTEKTDQLRSEVETLGTFAGYAESIVNGIDMLRQARSENYTTAIELAEDAIAEFEAVETGADQLEAPDSLAEERSDFVEHAVDWREHAEDRLEAYEDAQSD